MNNLKYCFKNVGTEQRSGTGVPHHGVKQSAKEDVQETSAGKSGHEQEVFEGDESVAGQDLLNAREDLIGEIQGADEESENRGVCSDDRVKNRKRKQPADGHQARDHCGHNAKSEEEQPPAERETVSIRIKLNHLKIFYLRVDAMNTHQTLKSILKVCKKYATVFWEPGILMLMGVSVKCPSGGWNSAI